MDRFLNIRAIILSNRLSEDGADSDYIPLRLQTELANIYGNNNYFVGLLSELLMSILFKYDPYH